MNHSLDIPSPAAPAAGERRRAELTRRALLGGDFYDAVLRSYKLHANAYVTKPVDFERFIEVVRQIDEFSVTVVWLPSR